MEHKVAMVNIGQNVTKYVHFCSQARTRFGQSSHSLGSVSWLHLVGLYSCLMHLVHSMEHRFIAALGIVVVLFSTSCVCALILRTFAFNFALFNFHDADVARFFFGSPSFARLIACANTCQIQSTLFTRSHVRSCITMHYRENEEEEEDGNKNVQRQQMWTMEW